MSDTPVPPAVGQSAISPTAPYDFDAVDLASRLRNHGNYTVGTLLTTVEAALGDSAQSEAVKAIVRREMYMLIDRNQAEIYEMYGMQKHGLAPKETYIDGQDSLKKESDVQA